MKDLPNEDLLYMAIEQMEGINIRRLLPAPIREFFGKMKISLASLRVYSLN